MEWIQAINKAIEYMEEHLLEDIHGEDVASHVHISLFHFQRTFSILTGMTMGEYMRKRRLSLAGEELTKEGIKVIDVAFKYGYESPESFSKAFVRFHGISPNQVKKGRELKYFNKLVVKVVVEGGTMLDYRIEKKEEFKLLVHAKMFTDENSREEIPAFWKEYNQNKVYEKIPRRFGICAQEKTDAKEFLYGIGCEVTEVKEVPKGFQVLNIPAYTWAIFRCVGAVPDAMQNMWKHIYREWLPVTEYELITDYDIENYLPGNQTSDCYISEIWLPIRTKTERQKKAK